MVFFILILSWHNFQFFDGADCRHAIQRWCHLIREGEGQIAARGVQAFQVGCLIFLDSFFSSRCCSPSISVVMFFISLCLHVELSSAEKKDPLLN